MACSRLPVPFAQDSKQGILHCCKHDSARQRMLEVEIRESRVIPHRPCHERVTEMGGSSFETNRILSCPKTVREVSENPSYRFGKHVESGRVRRTKGASFSVKYRIKRGVFARAYINLWLVIGRPPKPKVVGSTPARDIFLKPCKQRF